MDEYVSIEKIKERMRRIEERLDLLETHVCVIKGDNIGMFINGYKILSINGNYLKIYHDSFIEGVESVCIVDYNVMRLCIEDNKIKFDLKQVR